MNPVLTKARKKPSAAWNDTKLVKACLSGDEEAWSLLIDKYKALIYSIPVKYGLSREEAADVFQATCVELLVRLPDLRDLPEESARRASEARRYYVSLLRRWLRNQTGRLR